MVTGDNIQTAKAIASECGILGSDDDVTEPTLIEGRVFPELPELREKKLLIRYLYDLLHLYYLFLPILLVFFMLFYGVLCLSMSYCCYYYW